LTGDFVDNDKASTIGGTKLSVSVEKLDAVDGSVRARSTFTSSLSRTVSTWTSTDSRSRR